MEVHLEIGNLQPRYYG